MDADRQAEMQQKIADEMGISLFERFTESEAAAMLGISIQTLRRLRAKGEIAYLRVSKRHVRFFGFQLCDYLIENIEEQICQNETLKKNPKLATTGLANKPEATSGAGLGMITRLDKQNAQGPHTL